MVILHQVARKMCCFNHVHFVQTIISLLFFKDYNHGENEIFHIISRVEKETYCSFCELEVETGRRPARSMETKNINIGGKERRVG